MRVLRLAISAQVLVAKAVGDLEVAIKTGDHEDLFVELRRLRKRVEAARLQPRGNQKVPGTLGGALNQGRRFDLEEIPRVKKLPKGKGDLVPQLQLVLHAKGP